MATRTATKTPVRRKTTTAASKAEGFLAKAGAKRPGTRRRTAAAQQAAPTRKPLPLYEAPADFKPHFLEVVVKTEKDGLLGSQIKATRYQGRYDVDADDRKKSDLGSYDPATLLGIMSRLAAVTYRSNQKRYPASIKERNVTEFVESSNGDERERLVYRVAHRLPANTAFRILFRINRKAADGSLSVLLKHVEQGTKSAKTGRPLIVMLEKSDPVHRAFGKARRILPAAFKNVQLPPKRVRGQRARRDEDE